MQVLLAYPVRRELQQSAARTIWRLHSLPGGSVRREHAPAADAVLVQRLAMESSPEAAAEQAQPAATAEELGAATAAMAQLIDAFDVTDERLSFWWNRDGARAAARLRRHFGFVLRASRDLRLC